ncbi:RNA-binding protein 34 [Quercus lobata]|uniref:RRM domain-containing protein n=1 Tax=Quercus lobata TaxID=97700 RepID=A0A7N2N1T2_QUELO|nr:RNA-binding protein 34 [Quercus lobata]
MGKLKKSKEVTKSPKTDTDIFQSLFGIPQDAAVSIFSSVNPYKRNSHDQSGFAPAESLISQNPNLKKKEEEEEETKKKSKRKRDKESKEEISQNPNLVDDDGDDSVLVAEAPLEAKKSKKEVTLNANFVSESNSGSVPKGEENPDLGLKDREEKKKKKRKRDELERQYEAKKFGAVEEEEEEEKREKKVVVGVKRKTVDSVEDMVVSNNGFDDESKLLRTVFVGNLPLKIKKKALIKEFKQFGEIESVRIRSVPVLDTKLPRKGAILSKKINEAADCVHAYIVFKTEESAQASLSHNMAAVAGNHIRVDRACPPRKKLKGEIGSLYDSKRTIFVGNLPYDVKDEELYQLFSGIGNLGSCIEAIRVIRHSHISLGKGIAYVLFKTREAANMVVKKRNWKLRDRELRVSHARKDSIPSKRPNPSPAEAPTSPAKRLAMDPRTPKSNNRANTKAPLSYQGKRAHKSDLQKSDHPKSSRPGHLNSKNQREKSKEQMRKRPAVAARRAKETVRKDGGSSRQAGIKRKLDSQTPESFQQRKKFKKSK